MQFRPQWMCFSTLIKTWLMQRLGRGQSSQDSIRRDFFSPHSDYLSSELWRHCCESLNFSWLVPPALLKGSLQPSVLSLHLEVQMDWLETPQGMGSVGMQLWPGLWVKPIAVKQIIKNHVDFIHSILAMDFQIKMSASAKSSWHD